MQVPCQLAGGGSKPLAVAETPCAGALQGGLWVVMSFVVQSEVRGAGSSCSACAWGRGGLVWSSWHLGQRREGELSHSQCREGPWS